MHKGVLCCWCHNVNVDDVGADAGVAVTFYRYATFHWRLQKILFLISYVCFCAFAMAMAIGIVAL